MIAALLLLAARPRLAVKVETPAHLLNPALGRRPAPRVPASRGRTWGDPRDAHHPLLKDKTMTDVNSTPAALARVRGAPSLTTTGAIVGLAAIVATAVTHQAPLTAALEGTLYRAYRDAGGVPTICDGHTAGVRLGVVATKAQCDAWEHQDLTEHTAAALAETPALAEMPSALEQAGDFHFNPPRWWAGSPMATAFTQHRWRAGCEAFRGYIVSYRAPTAAPGRACRRDAKGVLYCQLPGLIARREQERALCLAGLSA